jgi:hypothetical protein
MWPVVKDLCTNGCWHVVLVRCTVTGRIVAYCRVCEAGWLSPADLEENNFGICSEFCPQSIEVPSREEVARSIWADVVKDYVQEAEYLTTSEINERLARERAELASKPARQWPPVVEPEAHSLRWFNIGERLRLRILRWLGFQGHPSMIERLRQAREQSKRDT